MSAVTSPDQSLPDFTELAALLQRAAQALAALCPPQAAALQAENPAEEAEPAQIRSFQIPGFACAEERRLLEQLRAETWQEMFYKVYGQLYTFAQLLQHFEADEEVDGVFLQQLGMTLMAPVATLSRLCSLVADFKPLPEAAPTGD